jgi:adenylate cyclase
MVEPIDYLIVGLFALGMGISFLTADPHAPTSRALSTMLLLLGLVFVMNMGIGTRAFGESRTWWIRAFSLLEGAILASGFEWILRIGRTAAPPGAAPGGDRLLRVAQALGCVYGLTGALFPEVREAAWNSPWSRDLTVKPAFYLFALPFHLALILAVIRIVQMLRGGLDPAERIRLVGLALAAPFWCAGVALPAGGKPVAFAFGEIIFLVAAIRYHVLQGQRGQFLARFASPQVMHLVRERGLANMLPKSRIELSVVACDLRGFTAFSETAAPEESLALLDEYYRAVGTAVTDFGGSIKDFAGDGILALVGAPIAYPDHGKRAIDTALAIRDRTLPILAHWQSLGLEIGIGIGVASGFVTVGVISGAQRLEYTAIGPAVNLAARLCSRADAGQILADQRLVGSLGGAIDGYRLEKQEPVELKGFARPVTVFALKR